MAVFLLLYLLWKIVHGFTLDPLVQLICAGLVIAVYVLGLYMLLRHYFDVMVATDNYLYIVLWDSFFKYRIKIITWHSIQDISLTPGAGLSALISDAHILIATEQDDIIEFHHVYKAAEVVSNLYRIRSHAVHEDDDLPPVSSQEIDVDDTKFKILVETLGEVIVDYMKKKE